MDIRSRIIDVISKFAEENKTAENAKQLLLKTNDLSTMNLNSISFVKLLVELENECNMEFEDEFLDYNKFKSLDSICQYIERRSNSR